MTGPPGALSDVRVVEYADDLAGAFAGKLLADLGAEVIKVEMPGSGDPLRRSAPTAPGLAEPTGRGLFPYLNGNKLSLTLDPVQPDGRARFEELLSGADVLIVSGVPRDISARRVGYHDLEGDFPQLVVATLTSFGWIGPWADAAADDLTICSLGAIANAVGEAGRPPLSPPLSLSSYQAGVAAVSGSLLALLARERTGRGQHVDISPLDVWGTVHQGSILANQVNFGHATTRAGRRRREAYPFQLMAAADGLMCMIARDGKQWGRFVSEVVCDPRLVGDERYRDRVAMGLRYPDEVDALLEPWFSKHSRQEIFELCREHRVPFAPVRRIDEVAACEQLASRRFFVEAPAPSSEVVTTVPGSPYLMSATPPVHGRAPALGEHDAIFADLASRKSRVTTQGSSTAESVLPLAGVRVLDLSWVLAGPAVGRMLADAGADVIKVESSGHLDNTRRARALPPVDGQDSALADAVNRVPMFHSLNAGKRSVAINLRSEEGVAVLKELVATCDVVIENYAPGVLRRLGLDYAVLREVRPDVVMLSMSGTGQEGPLSDVAAYAPTVTALAGLDSVVGYPGEDPLGVLGLNFADSVGALYGTYAVLAALWLRRQRGIGQHIDYSEMEGVITMMAQPLVEFARSGEVMAPTGSAAPGAAPYGVFPVAGADDWISLAIRSDEEWRQFSATTADQPWASDPAYDSASGRLDAQEKLYEAIAAYTREHDAAELVARWRAAGLAVAPVYSVADQVDDEHFWERGIFSRVAVDGLGDLLVTGSPYRLTQPILVPRGEAPRLGEHTDAVLHEIGLTSERIGELRAAGALT
ncbi:MAG TPA: CoA transferase [Nocardioides sp.]|jgi:crotonobetainyl-CoA:carnitine CoA-transferase CaiB-like acyl-CoA transferase|uniref:CaiB/BaiF CoA transferase family protein n=1 Tax=Nocardioides sp. TaxID=35761 RepID=UPI002E3715DA|nr:CoA transferase [Nocardioides sp.]HEX3930516.1 CoA transferase [Nocardioides sp.]